MAPDMIGVLCKPDEKQTVREFFQLFKTPWEFAERGRHYPAVLSTVADTPDAPDAVEAGLLLVFSSAPAAHDAPNGIEVERIQAQRLAGHDGDPLPIYRSLAAVRGQGRPLLHTEGGGEVVAVEAGGPGRKTLRIGYDLFGEIAFLLAEGQPVENAPLPALETHVALLRQWIVGAGVPLVEIPPLPRGHAFGVCLTHDVDFVSIRQHRFDHTWWGFVYRATVGSLLRFLRGRATLRQLAANWAAVLGLPLVALGLCRDYWDQFERYADIEREFSSTFFLIPFKDTPGEKVGGPAPYRRAARYDVLDVQEQVRALARQGFEIGLHGIDAWHSVEKGRQELARIVQATGQNGVGVRMHWLRFDQDSPGVLEVIGCEYDATCGYNDAIGYKAGTTQVFALPGVEGLLELPLHVQDTALFYSRRLGLSEAQAWERCMALLENARRYGGVLTVLWHMRSLAPERLWGEFYGRLLQALREEDAWFATARQMVGWFRRRRAVQFEAVELAGDALRVRLNGLGGQGELPLTVRVHLPGGPVDRPWSGEPLVEVALPPEAAGHFAKSFG